MNYLKDRIAFVARAVDTRTAFSKRKQRHGCGQCFLNQLHREAFLAICRTCTSNFWAPAPVNPDFLETCALASKSKEAKPRSEAFPTIAAPTRCPKHQDSLMIHEFPVSAVHEFPVSAVRMLTGPLFSTHLHVFIKVAWTSAQHFALLSSWTENRFKHY